MVATYTYVAAAPTARVVAEPPMQRTAKAATVSVGVTRVGTTTSTATSTSSTVVLASLRMASSSPTTTAYATGNVVVVSSIAVLSHGAVTAPAPATLGCCTAPLVPSSRPVRAIDGRTAWASPLARTGPVEAASTASVTTCGVRHFMGTGRRGMAIATPPS